MRKRFGKIAIATTTFAFATLISVDWSEQKGVSLSVDSAQARIGRPLTPVSVAGVARRQYRRAGYGYGYGAAVTAAAVAATSPWGYQSGPYNAYAGDQYAVGAGSYANSNWGYHECVQPNRYECQSVSQLGWYH
jgi:hypothetical protein